ncbi:MAG: 5'/3'-nucleotidase SurE [Myxococcota bacterium]
MANRPLILVTNDDGYDAAGIAALHQALATFADVITVAPLREQSAKSHAISLHRPLRHRVHAGDVHSVDGTPVDCVYVALFRTDLLPRRPDLVASGINHGPNLGSDVHYSGTVAAAREAAMRGVPAVAFSAQGRDFDYCAPVAASICQRFLNAALPAGPVPLLNVNFPKGSNRGLRPTRLGLRHYADGVAVRQDPRGMDYYWIGGAGGPRHERLEGSDTDAVDDGFVSVTPLSFSVTRADHMGIAAWVSSDARD